MMPMRFVGGLRSVFIRILPFENSWPASVGGRFGNQRDTPNVAGILGGSQELVLSNEVVPVFLDRWLRWIPVWNRRHRDAQEETTIHGGVQGSCGAGGAPGARQRAGDRDAI